MLEGRRQRWPNVPPAAVPQKMAVARAWAKLCVDIRGYTASLLSPTAYASSGGAAAHETYLRRVVLARVHLEATASAAEACCRRVAAARCVSVADVSSLHSRGFAIVDDVLGRAGIDCAALTRDIALLHKHGVIAPTNSSCNPGACGINLRCGTDDERAAFDKQRTPTLRAAIELLRSLPQVLLGLGYRGTRGGGTDIALSVQTPTEPFLPVMMMDPRHDYSLDAWRRALLADQWVILNHGPTGTSDTPVYVHLKTGVYHETREQAVELLLRMQFADGAAHDGAAPSAYHGASSSTHSPSLGYSGHP